MRNPASHVSIIAEEALYQPSPAFGWWFSGWFLVLVGLGSALGGGWVEYQRYVNTMLQHTEASHVVHATATLSALAWHVDQGTAPSLTHWDALRAKGNASLTTLRRLTPEARVEVQALTDLWRTLDETWRPLKEQAPTLEKGRRSVESWSETLGAMPDLLQAARSAPGLLVVAIKAPLDRIAQGQAALLGTAPVVTWPPGATTLTTWVRQWQEQHQALMQIAEVVQQSAQIARTDQEALRAWVKGSQAVLDVAQAITEGVSAWRTTQGVAAHVARQALSPPLPTLTRFAQSAPEVYSWRTSLALGGFGGVVCGLLVLGITALRARRAWQDSTRDLANISQNSDAWERFSQRVQGVLETPIGSGARIQEDHTQPTFTIAEQIDRVLDQRDAIRRAAQRRIERTSRLLSEGIKTAGATFKRLESMRGSMDAASQQARQVATQLATVSQRQLIPASNQARQAVHVSEQVVGFAKDQAYRMDVLRRHQQEHAKRVKRLGESVQTVNGAADVIRDISRRVQVLAINVAIQAAANGTAGSGRFSVIAQEIQRLAKIGNDSATHIDALAQDIQTDVREAVTAMENSTGEVVEAGRISTHASQAVHTIAQHVQAVVAHIEKANQHMVEHAVQGGQAHRILQDIQEELTLNFTEAVRIHDTLGQIEALDAVAAKEEHDEGLDV